ncbi:MAG: lamin tail domain-containing protein [Planctomycetaceae bacterium]|nr:lamin tail domain-containing protein [Planctomycetaceae bacterium]
MIAASALAAALPAGDAAIIISEIMYNPQGTDYDLAAATPYNREWVELYNTGASSVDLSGWQFGDVQDNNWASPFPAGTTLGAGRALVVTGDSASLGANWGAGVGRVQVNAFPTLANTVGTNEGAAIRNHLGVLQDVVRFQETGWPTANGSDGNSIYLLPGALDARANDLRLNWKPSSAGVYGAKWTSAGGQGENHGSPGFVATTTQAPIAPSPNAAWSMVVMPDTQNYSKSSRDLPIFSQLTHWIKDHKEEYKIQVVLQEGDIVNQNSQVAPTSGDQTADQQWANAKAAMSVLNGKLPYIMAAGNHDLGTTSAQNRNTQFNTYFKASDNPLVDPAQGGVLRGYQVPGELQNAYFELHAPDGRDLLIFSLEFWPRQATVAWANQIAALPQYADHTAVLLTHSYLNPNNTRADGTPDGYPVGTDGNDGEELWNELIKLNPNFEMTLNGHVGGDGVGYLKSTGPQGNVVHQMVFNSQFETNGGNGWIRVLEFLNDRKTVHVRTYSPLLDLYRTDAANDFFFTLTELPRVEYAAADFNHDGFVDGADLTVWRTNFGVVGTATAQTGDADGDLDVDGADYLLWQQQFAAAATASASQAAVPEPSALLLGVSAFLMTRCRRRVSRFR